LRVASDQGPQNAPPGRTTVSPRQGGLILLDGVFAVQVVYARGAPGSAIGMWLAGVLWETR
ncbi:MAG: hypothetical protein DRI40_02100, partial [Chloroflexi bacterium]